MLSANSKAVVKSVGFQRGGGATFEIKYKGPDTGDAYVFPRSSEVSPTPQKWSVSDGWKVSLYRGQGSGMGRTPDTDRLSEIGTTHATTAYRSSRSEFQKLMNGVPSKNFVWKYQGKLRIILPGRYNLCTKSDDGSSLFISGNNLPERMLVDNEGQHDARRRCNEITLQSDDYNIRVVGFTVNKRAYERIRYNGPDTDWLTVDMPSMRVN